MSGRHWGRGSACFATAGLWLALGACGARSSLLGFELGAGAGAANTGVAGALGGGSAGASTGGSSNLGLSGSGGSTNAGAAGVGGCVGMVSDQLESNLTPRIALAATSGCALDSTFQARCWGKGPSLTDPLTPPPGPLLQVAAQDGEYVGVDALANRPAFWGLLLVPGPAPMGRIQQAVVTGTGVACAIASCTGTVQCWPPNDKQGTSNPPPLRFLQIAGGGSHVCGVEYGGALQCWGDNTYGQSSPPAGKFLSVTSGLQHSCAISSSDGHVACWGAGSAGAPVSTQNFGQGLPPTGVFQYLGAGAFHTCGVADDDSVKCWGAGSTAQNCSSPPYECGQAIAPSGAFRQVAGGITHSCGIRFDGSLACWGSNEDGRSTPPADFK